MTAVLALFTRSLREYFRGKAALHLHIAICGFVLLLLWSVQAASVAFGAPGQMVFASVIWLNYFLTGLAGLMLGATAIAEEKEEQTLGLLRMTNLHPLSLLLGKFAGRLVVLLLLVVVQVPFTLMAVAMGGVAVQQVLIAFALLVGFLFAVTNFTLLCSVLSKRVWQAAVLSLAVFVVGSILLFWLHEKIVSAWNGSSTDVGSAQFWLPKTEWLISVHPLTHLGSISTSNYLGIHFGGTIFVHVGFGLACFFLAVLLFEKFSHGLEDAAAPGQRQNKKRRGSRPHSQAIAWKDFRIHYGGWRWVGLRAVLYFGFFAAVRAHAALDLAQFADALWVAGLMMFCVESAVLAAVALSRERWSLTLPALVAVPLPLSRIYFEKLKAAWLVLIPSVALLLAAIAVDFDRALRSVAQSSPFYYASADTSRPDAFALAAGALHLLIPNAFFLSLVLNLSLRMKWAALPVAIGIFGLSQVAVNLVAFTGVSTWLNAAWQFTIAHLATTVIVFSTGAFFLLRSTHRLVQRCAALS
jgi:ABC-type transport system involved in multi-copper enzyme maturation permease subunit